MTTSDRSKGKPLGTLTGRTVRRTGRSPSRVQQHGGSKIGGLVLLRLALFQQADQTRCRGIEIGPRLGVSLAGRVIETLQEYFHTVGGGGSRLYLTEWIRWWRARVLDTIKSFLPVFRLVSAE